MAFLGKRWPLRGRDRRPGPPEGGHQDKELDQFAVPGFSSCYQQAESEGEVRYPGLGKMSPSLGPSYQPLLQHPVLATTLRFTACSARPRLECHILLLGRGPTPLLWRGCRPHSRVTCGQRLGEPLSVLRAVPLGASGLGAPVRVHVPIIYSPPPAPGSAHHPSTLCPPCPTLPHGFQSGISAVSWAPNRGTSGYCFLREQEILLHSALGARGRAPAGHGQ